MIKLNSKIYVAGHTGLVGSAILRKLKQKGYKNVFTISRKKLDLKDQNKVFRYLKKIKPDFIFYLCGVDILGTDKLGRLDLSLEGCRSRDQLVFKTCHQKGIPMQCSMGGGYSKDINIIVEAHANTYREAAKLYF